MKTKVMLALALAIAGLNPGLASAADAPAMVHAENAQQVPLKALLARIFTSTSKPENR